jgi:hypothetical protein
MHARSGRAPEKKSEVPGERDSREVREQAPEFVDELAVLAGVLDDHQLRILVELDRLEKSLHGPQALLEVAGGFSRPTPPAYTPPQNGSTDPPFFKD